MRLPLEILLKATAGAGAVHGTSWELEEVRGNAVKTMLTLAAISTVASLQVRLPQQSHGL